MIAWPRQIRVYAYPEPADMRKGFTGLMGLVDTQLKMDAVSGDIFLFLNRRRTIAKVLIYDGTGLGIYMKRLLDGRFASFWHRHHAGVIQLTSGELALFLDGSPQAISRPLALGASEPRLSPLDKP